MRHGPYAFCDVLLDAQSCARVWAQVDWNQALRPRNCIRYVNHHHLRETSACEVHMQQSLVSLDKAAKALHDLLRHLTEAHFVIIPRLWFVDRVYRQRARALCLRFWGPFAGSGCGRTNKMLFWVDESVPGQVQREQKAVLTKRTQQVPVALWLQQVPADVEVSQRARLTNKLSDFLHGWVADLSVYKAEHTKMVFSIQRAHQLTCCRPWDATVDDSKDLQLVGFGTRE